MEVRYKNDDENVALASQVKKGKFKKFSVESLPLKTTRRRT
jgi:hypothetical protein